MADEKEATVVWRGGMQFEGSATSGFTLMLDAREDVGGNDEGFRPMELILVGLAGCTAMDVISILRKKRQGVTGFEVRARGERSESHPKVYTHIWLEYVVRGRSISPAAVERAIELSETKYCSVHPMIRVTVPVTSSYRIEEEDTKEAPDSSPVPEETKPG
jgi:putative redox protein